MGIIKRILENPTERRKYIKQQLEKRMKVHFTRPHPRNITIPTGENPFVYLIEQARSKNPNPAPGQLIPIYLPKGVISGACIGGRGWTPNERIDPWWGDAVLMIVGHPDGTVIKPVNNEGWGATFEVYPESQSPWGGYMHFCNLIFQASGSNVLQLGRYGTQEQVPLKGLVFKRCQFVDHPIESITTIRPISANQCSLNFINCTWDLKRSREHAVYSRNPYGLNRMKNCRVVSVGGQVWQEVNRPPEGPYYPNGLTVLDNNYFCCYHKDPGRAGSAITIAGSGRDIGIYNNVVIDLDESDDVYGGMVVWDGNHSYGDHPNLTINITDNIFVQKNGNRDIFSINACKVATIRNNGFFGNKPCGISDQDQQDIGIDMLDWYDNNLPEYFELARQLGIPEELLEEHPPVKFKRDIIGDVSETFNIFNNELS